MRHYWRIVEVKGRKRAHWCQQSRRWLAEFRYKRDATRYIKSLRNTARKAYMIQDEVI